MLPSDAHGFAKGGAMERMFPFARDSHHHKICVLIDALVNMAKTLAEARELAGISERTFFRWKARGEAGEEPYATLAFALDNLERERANSALRREIEKMLAKESA